jgi:tetratricopeptide (TPR) repeat protein
MNKVLPNIFSILFFSVLLLCAACTSKQEIVSSKTLAPETAQQPLKKTENKTILFLEERIKRDPEDFIAYNKLASEYLKLMRETGDANYLQLALRAAKTSLEILPAHQNKEGLAVLALVKYSSHEFAESRDHARQLVELEPNKGFTYQILGDALLELGEYAEAEKAFDKMQTFGGIQPLTKSAMEQRLARLALLEGDNKKAKNHYSNALKIVSSLPEPPPETVAYCNWQLGETAFFKGDYKTAEKYYKNALNAFPDYTNALASTGKTRAALGDTAGAIEFYERAVKRLPDISFVAALGDLYKIAGRDEDAKNQYELVEQIGRLSAANGNLYNRSLALFYADHDLKPEEAYNLAAKEYETRRDIYGANALAWAALKAGKIDEAREKSKESLRFGTLDARLFYHAGMIANAAGDKATARKYLRQALELNPKFQILQAEICRRTLDGL